MAALNFFSAYPKGDQDELFALGDAWKQAATELGNLETDLKQVTGGFSQYYTGEGADAILKDFAGYFDSSDTSLPALVNSLNQLGHDARATAAEIEYTKIQAEIFALLTLVAVGQLLASLAGSLAVPAYLAVSREVLAAFARTMMERIEAITARAATRTLAKAVTKEIAIPLAERAVTKAPASLLANTLKGGAIMAGLGAASDAGVQAIQLGEGHLDDGFDLKKTFQTSIEWGIGGLIGGPAHIKIADMLGKRGLSPRLGGLISGGLGGMAGGVGMYGGGLGNQIYDHFKNSKRIDWSFSPQLLLGGAALGGAGGLRHGIRNGHAAPIGEGPSATTAGNRIGTDPLHNHVVTPDSNANGRSLYRGLQRQLHSDVLDGNAAQADIRSHSAQINEQLSKINSESKTLGGYSDQHVARLEDLHSEWQKITVEGGDGSVVHPDAGTTNSHTPASPPEQRAGAPGSVRPADVPTRPATDYTARPGIAPDRAGDPSALRDPALNRQSTADSPARIVASTASPDNATNVAAGNQDKAAPASQVSPPRTVTAGPETEIRPAPSELTPRRIGTDTPDAAAQPQRLPEPQRPLAGDANLRTGDHQPAVPNQDANPAADSPPSPTGSELVPTTPPQAGKENPLEFRRRIDHITGVEPDPAQAKIRADLQDFYRNQNIEAADATPVTPREAPSGSPAPAYETRRFSYGPDNFVHSLTIRLHLDGVDHLPNDHLARILDQLHATVDSTFNTGQRLLSGDHLQIHIELTDNLAEAHLRATVGDPQHISDPRTWTRDTHPDTLARQLREHLGLSTDPSKQELDHIDVRQLSNDIATANTDNQIAGLPRTRVIAEHRLDDLETPTHQWAVEDALRDGNGFLVGADPRTNPYGDLVNDGGPHNDGRGNNCLDNSLAALSSFHGDPQVAHPRWPDVLPDGTIDQWGPEQLGNERALDWLGGGFSTWAGQINPPDVPQQFAWLHDHLSQLGEMSSALVINKWNGPGAHATVVVYPKGAKGPLWWDPQQRTISETPPVSLTHGSTGLWFRALDPNEPNGGITGAGAVPNSAASGAIPGPDLSSGSGIHHPAERVRLDLPPETHGDRTSEPDHATGAGPGELRGERPDRSGDSPLEPVDGDDRAAVRRSDTDPTTDTRPSDLSPSLDSDDPAGQGGPDRDRVPGDRRIPDHATGTEHGTSTDHRQEHPAVPNEPARNPGAMQAREGLGLREPDERNLAGNRDVRVLDEKPSPPTPFRDSAPTHQAPNLEGSHSQSVGSPTPGQVPSNHPVEDKPYYANPDFIDPQAERRYVSKYEHGWREVHTIRAEESERHPAIAGLTDAELHAIRRNQFMDLNEAVNNATRWGDLTALETYDPEIRTLVSAYNKLPDHQGIVYRSLHLGDPVALERLLDAYQQGKVVPDHGFASSDKSTSMPGGNVELIIDSRYGKDISWTTPAQEEVVFPPGNHFLVKDQYVGADRYGNPKFYIELLDLGREHDDTGGVSPHRTESDGQTPASVSRGPGQGQPNPSAHSGIGSDRTPTGNRGADQDLASLGRSGDRTDSPGDERGPLADSEQKTTDDYYIPFSLGDAVEPSLHAPSAPEQAVDPAPEPAPHETSLAAVESGAPSPDEKPFTLSTDHKTTASPPDAGAQSVEPTGSGPQRTPPAELPTREPGKHGHPQAELADLGQHEENPLPTTELARIEQSLPITEMVPTEEVRFTQRTVSRMTSTGVLLTDLAASMAEKGWRGGPLHAVVLDDGRIVSLDNRRLTATRMAGFEQVPTAIHAPSERLADWPHEWDATRGGRYALAVDIRQLADGTLRAGGDQGVVLYRRGQIPETWGEFAQFRMADPRNPFPSDLTGSGHAPVYAAKPAEKVDVQLPAADKEYIAAAVENARPEADLILDDLRAATDQVTTDLGTAHNPLELRGEEHRVKSEESLERKYYTEREHGESVDQFIDRVNDLIRFSARLPAGEGYLPALEATFERLRGQGYEVVDVKNFWLEGNRYYGLNSTLRSPVGREFEVQFPTDTAWRANKLTHEPYEIFRRGDEPIERRIHAFLDTLRINSELGLAHEIPPGISDRWPAVDTSLNKWTGKNPAPWQGYHSWLAENNRGLSWVTEQFGLDLRKMLPNYESSPHEVANTPEADQPLLPHEFATKGSIALEELSREAQQFVLELSTVDHIGVEPGEVSTTHLAELQRYTGVEHAVVQNAAGELRLLRGAESIITIPESLRGEYEFTVHTHPEERLPGPASEHEISTAAATGDSMRLDVLHKVTPYIEAVVSSDGQVRFFDDSGVLPAGTHHEGGPIDSQGRVVPVRDLAAAKPSDGTAPTREMARHARGPDGLPYRHEPGNHPGAGPYWDVRHAQRDAEAAGPDRITPAAQAFRNAAVEFPTRPHQERAADAYRLPGESAKPIPAVPERYEKLPAEAAAKGLQLGRDGLLFKENDKPDHWRSAKDGHLHEKNDRAGTYRDEGYNLRDVSKPSQFAKDQNVDHSGAPLYKAQKGKETSYQVTETTSAKALDDKSIARIDQQADRDPAGAAARVHFPEFGINHINELSAKKLTKKVAELTGNIKKENISSADKKAKLDRLDEMRDNADKYHTIGTEMNNTSKTMGEIATLAYANDPAQHPNAVVLAPLGRAIDGRDTFDIPVFLRESEGQPPTFKALEAKGLGSELGDADTPVGRAEQCSSEYYARTMMEEKNLALLLAETPETLRARGIDPNEPRVQRVLEARDEMMRAFQNGTLVYKCEKVHVDINGRVTVTEYILERDGIAMTIDNIAGIERVRTPLLELAKQRELELVRVIEKEREQILATFTPEQREIIQLTLDIADENRSFAAAQQIILTHEALTNIVRAMDDHDSPTQVSKSLVDANDAAAKAIQLESDSRLAGLRELDLGRDAEVIKQLVGLDSELRNHALIAQINILERELVNRAIAQTIDAREVPSKDRAIFVQHNLNLVRAIEPGAPPEKLPQLRELCDAYDSVRQVNEQERGRDAHALERMGLDESHARAVRQALEADRSRTLERAEEAFAREIVRQASEQTRDARSQEQDVRARSVEQVRELERDYLNGTEPSPVPIREVHDALHRVLEQERAREAQTLERLQLGDHQTQQVARALEVEHRRDAGQTLDVLSRELQRQEHNRMFGPDSGMHIPGRAVEKFDARTYQLCRENLPVELNAANRALVYQQDGRTIEVPYDSEARRLAQAAQELEHGRTLEQVQINYALSVGQAREAEAAVRDRQTEAAQVVRARQLEAAARERSRDRSRRLL